MRAIKWRCGGGHKILLCSWGIPVMFLSPHGNILALGQTVHEKRVRECEVSDVRENCQRINFCLQLWCERSTLLGSDCLRFQLSGRMLFGLDGESLRAVILFWDLIARKSMRWEIKERDLRLRLSLWGTRAANVSVTTTLGGLRSGNGNGKSRSWTQINSG